VPGGVHVVGAAGDGLEHPAAARAPGEMRLGLAPPVSGAAAVQQVVEAAFERFAIHDSTGTSK
jgi:hypothetical protein